MGFLRLSGFFTMLRQLVSLVYPEGLLWGGVELSAHMMSRALCPL